MGSTLSHAITSVHHRRVRVGRARVASGEMQGLRPTMEDRLCVCAVSPGVLLVGLFDGHAGVEAAEFAEGALPGMAAALDDPLDPEQLASVLPRIDDALRAEHPHCDSGSCALVAAVDAASGRVAVAHLGDSRAVVLRGYGASGGGENEALTEDHKPSAEAERARIIEAGGTVSSTGRVNGRLAVSRALGDYSFKGNAALPPERQAVTAHAESCAAELREGDALLLACDGCFEAMPTPKVAETLRAEADPQAAVAALMHASVAAGSGDNHAAVLVVLGGDGDGQRYTDTEQREFLPGRYFRQAQGDGAYARAYIADARQASGLEGEELALLVAERDRGLPQAPNFTGALEGALAPAAPLVRAYGWRYVLCDLPRAVLEHAHGEAAAGLAASIERATRPFFRVEGPPLRCLLLGGAGGPRLLRPSELATVGASLPGPARGLDAAALRMTWGKMAAVACAGGVPDGLLFVVHLESGNGGGGGGNDDDDDDDEESQHAAKRRRSNAPSGDLDPAMLAARLALEADPLIGPSLAPRLEAAGPGRARAFWEALDAAGDADLGLEACLVPRARRLVGEALRCTVAPPLPPDEEVTVRVRFVLHGSAQEGSATVRRRDTAEGVREAVFLRALDLNPRAARARREPQHDAGGGGAGGGGGSGGDSGMRCDHNDDDDDDEEGEEEDGHEKVSAEDSGWLREVEFARSCREGELWVFEQASD